MHETILLILIIVFCYVAWRPASPPAAPPDSEPSEEELDASILKDLKALYLRMDDLTENEWNDWRALEDSLSSSNAVNEWYDWQREQEAIALEVKDGSSGQEPKSTVDGHIYY